MLNRIIEQKLGTEINYEKIIVDWLKKTKIGNREDQITAVLISTNIGSREKAIELVNRASN